MKKILSGLLLSCLVSNVAIAAGINDLKLQTIKNMYQSDIKTKAGNKTLYKFAGNKLKAAMNKDAAYGAKNDGLCIIDYDIMWQSQDPNYRDKLAYSLTPNGQVKVRIGKQGSVNYALECSAQACKVSDVMDQGSLINAINKECR